jgi:hypothetical protein
VNDMTWPRRDGVVERPAQAPGRLAAGVAAVFGAALSLVFLVGALGVAVVFAATLAVVLALAVVLTALSAAAWRVRPRSALAVARAGHAWVRYGPDRRLH